MILTAEGIAPYAGAASSTLTRSNVARRIIEVSVKKQDTAGPCAGRSGQIGGGPEGNNVFGGVCGGDINNAVADLSFAPGGKTRITP